MCKIRIQVWRLLTLMPFTCFMIFSGGACRRIIEPGNGYTYEAVYVDSLLVPETVPSDTPVVIRIKGGLPDPSCTFDRFDISTDYANVYVEPIGKQEPNPGVVPQVIVPYDESFKFTFFRPGPRTIHAIGRVNTLTKRIIIEE